MAISPHEVPSEFSDSEPTHPALAPMSHQDFQKLWESNYRVVFGHAFLMTRSYQDAEDLAQDTFEKAFKKGGSIREPNVSSWLHTTLHNTGIDSIRHKQRQPKSAFAELDELPGDLLAANPTSSDPAEVLEMHETFAQIGFALEALPRETAQALILRDFLGLTYREITQIQGTDLATTKSRIYISRETVIKCFDQQQLGKVALSKAA